MNRRTAIITAIPTAVALLLAAGLRFWASWDDFWLDEIWTWVLVQQQVSSWLNVLLVLTHENNHFLNTWWIFALGPDVDWRWYRVPPVLLGVGTVLLLRRAAADSGPVGVWVVTVLTVPSYLLVHYSSEARGYAYFLFFAVGAYLLLKKTLPPIQATSQSTAVRPPRWPWIVVLFGMCCIAGCLGHPAFLLVYVALCGWATVRIGRMRWRWDEKPAVLIQLFLIPTLGLGALWVLNLSEMVNGGGPSGEPFLVAIETLSLMVGGPQSGPAAMVIGGLVAVAVGTELILLARAGDDRWVFWLGVTVGPLLLILVTQRKEVYPRYYLGAVVFLYLVLAHLASRGVKRGRAGQIAVIALCALITLGNGLHLARLFEFGRGHGLAMVRWIDSQTIGPQLVISSDQDFRHSMLLNYYSTRMKSGKPVVFVPTARLATETPEWLLTHSFQGDWTPEPQIDLGEKRYRLARVFRYAGLSGWHTAVYRIDLSDTKAARNL